MMSVGEKEKESKKPGMFVHFLCGFHFYLSSIWIEMFIGCFLKVKLTSNKLDRS